MKPSPNLSSNHMPHAWKMTARRFTIHSLVLTRPFLFTISSYFTTSSRWSLEGAPQQTWQWIMNHRPQVPAQSMMISVNSLRPTWKIQIYKCCTTYTGLTNSMAGSLARPKRRGAVTHESTNTTQHAHASLKMFGTVADKVSGYCIPTPACNQWWTNLEQNFPLVILT